MRVLPLTVTVAEGPGFSYMANTIDAWILCMHSQTMMKNATTEDIEAAQSSQRKNGREEDPETSLPPTCCIHPSTATLCVLCAASAPSVVALAFAEK